MSDDICLDLRVEQTAGNIHVYDKLGRGGRIELSTKEAEYVRDRLDDFIEDDG